MPYRHDIAIMKGISTAFRCKDYFVRYFKIREGNSEN